MIAAESMLASFSETSFVERADGVALIAAGLPVSSLNQVVIENDAASPQGVAAAVALLRERKLPFVVTLRSGADDRFVPSMTRLGLMPMTKEPWPPGMALSPISAELAPMPHGYEVIQVRDVDALEDHVRTIAAGFEMQDSLARALLGSVALERDDAAFYTGYANREPVATGVGFRTERTIGIYNVSTTPSARRHGYGEAMTRRIAHDGARAGCDLAVLQPSRKGFPMYGRIGYRTVVHYVTYGEPALTD